MEGEIVISVNGRQRLVARETTVAGLIEQLGMAARHVAVEVNFDLVPRADHDQRVLGDGDSLEIVTLVGGG